MDNVPATSDITTPSGINKVSVELVQHICDHLPISGVYNLARSNKSLWAVLQFYLYKRSINPHHLINPFDRGFQNIVRYGIQNDWNISSLELAIKAGKQVWAGILVGQDAPTLPPPLHMAAERNRGDVISILERNLVNLSASYGDWGEPVGYRSCQLNLHLCESSGMDSTACSSVLDAAIKNKHLNLTEMLLAKPMVPVRPASLDRALNARWRDGIDAIIASGRLQKTQVTKPLNKALHDCAERDDGDWIEYLVSLGADARYEQDYDLYSLPPGLSSTKCRGTVLDRACARSQDRVVDKLLEIFLFDQEYLMEVLRRCSQVDATLGCTKAILRRTSSDATSWKIAYISAVESYNRRASRVQETIQFLLRYCHSLVASGVALELDAPLTGSGKRVLEQVLEITVTPWLSNCYPDSPSVLSKQIYDPRNYDWVMPLFQFPVDVTLLSRDGWDLYRCCEWKLPYSHLVH